MFKKILFLMFIASNVWAQPHGQDETAKITDVAKDSINWQIANSLMTMVDTTLGWYMGRTTDRLGLDSGGNDSRYIHSSASSGNFYLNLTTDAQGVIGINFGENMDAASAISASITFLSGDLRMGYGASRNSKYIGISSTGAVTISELADGTLSAVSGVITSSSDARLKNLRGSFSAGLQALKGIRPMRYKWNSESGLDTEREYAGFVAQNVEYSIPEAVSIGKNGMRSLNTTPILAAAVNAINELHNENNKLKKRIAFLERLIVKNLLIK